MEAKDTISAIATPLGEGGISIIRVSGPDSEALLQKLFYPRNLSQHKFTPRYQYLGEIRDPETESLVDEVIAVLMKEPKSYTGEDMVEIYAHGGIIASQKILTLFNSLGARLADRGEFTKRAFLNGRIDLSQAESVIDVVKAKTEKGLGLAVKQLTGELAETINGLKSELLEILAYVEAEIDFPDEDISGLNLEETGEQLAEIEKNIERLLHESEKGKIYREGLNIAIIGRPNVGKSSLLNALLREKRAIVTEFPGTTRDIIEEYINIAGIPLKIIDTAGIRSTFDSVEKIGVELARETLAGADLVLYVLDASEKINADDENILLTLKELDKKSIVLINKVDLNNTAIDKNSAAAFVSGEEEILEISAKEKKGLDALEKVIEEMIFGAKVESSESILVTRERHRQHLEDCRRSIAEAKKTLESGLPEDFLSIDLKTAWESLGKITGEVVEEDILDKIFSEFCIGK